MNLEATAIKRLATLYDTINQGIVFLDRQGKVVCLNRAAAPLLGRPFLNLDQIPLDDVGIRAVDENEELLSPDRYPPMAALRTGQKIQNFVMGVFNPVLNERRWFSVDASPVCDPGDAEPSLAYAIFRDITEQRNADRELRQSKMHLALAQRIASIGSAAVDFRTGKWDWSDETFRIYGVDRSNFTPSADGLGSLVHPEDWPGLHANVPRAQEGIPPELIAEYRIRRPDGDERTLRRIATLVRDQTGNPTGIVATVQDVTDLRAAQAETKALQNQLYHAQRLDSLGTLASGIAHDLNNTLVPVVALSEAVLHALAADDPNRPLMELIRDGGKRAADLVAQVLAFARREVGERELIDIGDFVRQSLRLVRASVPQAIKIVERLDVTARVKGNPGQLHQVLLNLVANASHAIGEGPGQIELSMHDARGAEFGGETGRRYIRMSVADTGCGMTADVQARIFEPFFTTKRVGTGSGLGLSVVHGIVASHEGQISVKSTPGNGARFDVFLPIVES
jgi:signal transduction histidine kinase